mmetsp:Transcript_6604/g.11082  ORF Transcript_6604/g.11082 Transcript_6604/m.11082 type:complete len:304 (+) Transcript_6604:121-1032(+)
MRRCAHDVNNMMMMVCRNLLKHQRLRSGQIISLPSAAVVIQDSNYSDLTTFMKHPSSSRKNSLQHHESIRTFATNSHTESTEYPSSLSVIQGTIPLHGKGLKMGQYAKVHRKFTQEDVNLFGRLSGDMNPVHFPPSPTEQTAILQESTTSSSSSSSSSQHKPPIVHGILLSSLFSNIFGNLIPGAIYRHQSLKFHNVVYVNDNVVGRVVVTKLRQINRKGRGGNGGGNGGGGGGVLCTCDTSVIKISDAVQKEVDNSATRSTNTNENNTHHDGSKEEIVCISGDAQVWLPDLQLVYECREKGE